MLERQRLANGLVLEFRDDSRRYFGDYHRVCVEACIIVELPDGDPAWHEVRQAFGTQLTLRKRLERMAVPTAEVDQVRRQLVADYLTHAAGYLAAPECPHRLAAAELARLRRPRQAYP